MMLEKFKNNDRVAFVGDSITHCGEYIAHIANCYKEIYPQNNIMFFNCGVAGASIYNCGFKLMDEDVLSNRPNIAVIMYGMNDSGRENLTIQDETEKNKILNKMFNDYKANLEKLVTLYLEKDIKVILCTPTPYDEFSKSQEKALPGGYALLEKYACFVREFAKKRHIPLVDFNLVFQPFLAKGYIKEDHVHPNSKGHLEMAKYFLSLQGISLENETLLPLTKKWFDITVLLRDIVATRFLIIGLDIEDIETKIEKCKAVKKDYEGSEFLPYFTELSDKFLNHHDEKLLRKQVNDALLVLINS